MVRNPMNFHQVSKMSLAPDAVDCIVFWTKNPTVMINRLDELRNYTYYFQFTITPYGKDIEENLPSKTDVILPTFKRLSEMIGADRVIWRYDPILINEKYTVDYHVDAFGKIANTLRGFTRKVTISFIDTDYRGVKRNAKALALLDIMYETQMDLGEKLAKIAHSCDLSIDACLENMDLQQFGIERTRCIDARLIAKLLGRELTVGKAKSQRPECECAASTDIGMYNTCLHGCRYCYANYNHGVVDKNFSAHRLDSALISGVLGEDDKITERKVKSLKG